MKRRFTVVLPGILYAAVLIGLLLPQSKAIESTGDRIDCESGKDCFW